MLDLAFSGTHQKHEFDSDRFQKKTRPKGDQFCSQFPFNIRWLKYSTHLNFIIAPEKLPSQKESSIPTIIFQGLIMWNFGGVKV